MRCGFALANYNSLAMTYGVVFERIREAGTFSHSYYAHIPALGLTTHGEGIEGARAAALDLLTAWLAEKREAGETIETPSEILFSTVEVPQDALQSA
jgi:predicted RNase H-like HicB family nuclease